MVWNIFYFHPYFRKVSNLTNVFQRGWNHQLDLHGCFFQLSFVSFRGCFFSPLPWFWEATIFTFILLMATRNPARKPVSWGYCSSFSHYLLTRFESTILSVVCFKSPDFERNLSRLTAANRVHPGRACRRDGGGRENLNITSGMRGKSSQPKKGPHGGWLRVFCVGDSKTTQFCGDSRYVVYNLGPKACNGMGESWSLF